MIRAGNEQERVRAQQGWLAAQEKFKTARHADLPRYAGTAVAIDHTVLDIYVCSADGHLSGVLLSRSSSV